MPDNIHVALIDTSTTGGIAIITLNNPPLNVVTVELTAALGRILDSFTTDASVRAVVLTGAGERAFCAGSDIKEVASFVGPEGRVLERKMIGENAIYSKLAGFKKPTIAALNGSALGGGLELAVCCDLLVAAENVKLSLPEVKIGVFPGAGGTVRVARRIGEGRAKEMMFLGEPIDAATALSWGLINRVAPAGKALEASIELAGQLADLATGAIGICKEAIRLGQNLAEGDAIEATLPLIEKAFEADEIQEGVRAFLAKEKPRFRRRTKARTSQCAVLARTPCGVKGPADEDVGRHRSWRAAWSGNGSS